MAQSSPNSFSNVKKTFDKEIARRHRLNSSQRIRRAKRDESLSRRRLRVRNGLVPDVAQFANADGNVVVKNESVCDDSMTTLVDLDDELQVQALLENVFDTKNVDNALAAVKQLCDVLSVRHAPPFIDRVIALGVVPRLVQFLQCMYQPQLQHAAAWTLTNLACGSSDQIHAIVQAGAVEQLVTLIQQSPNEDVCKQCAWALTNIATGSPAVRERCLRAGALRALIEKLSNSSPSISVARRVCAALSHFFLEEMPLDLVPAALPAFARLLVHDDPVILTNACWWLSYIAAGGDDWIQAVVETGVVPRAVELLSADVGDVRMSALCLVNSIVSGTVAQVNTVIKANVMPALHGLLRVRKQEIRKTVFWVLSNIAAGDEAHVQTVISAGMIPILAHALLHQAFNIKKEACWAIVNATRNGTDEQIRAFTTPDVVAGLRNIVDGAAGETILVKVALEGLQNILRAGTVRHDINIFVGVFETTGTVEVLEDLACEIENADAHEIVHSILTEYFQFESESASEDDESML